MKSRRTVDLMQASALLAAVCTLLEKHAIDVRVADALRNTRDQQAAIDAVLRGEEEVL